MGAEYGQRQARTELTRASLMRAVEKLASQRGLENVSVKAIIDESGQKNESALQYHFKNLQGLIEAVHKSRFAQTQLKRRELLLQLLESNPKPELRNCCKVLVEPTFLLSRIDPGYQQWIKAFAIRNATANHPMLEKDQVADNDSILLIERLLKAHLTQLPESMYESRFLAVVRFSSMSMGNHAREKKAFRGPGADAFFNNLVDQLTGIFAAEVSVETFATLSVIK